MHGSEAELGSKVGGHGEAGVTDDHNGAAPPAHGRRRVTMPSTDMEAMWALWCTDLRSENCSVRQMTFAITL